MTNNLTRHLLYLLAKERGAHRYPVVLAATPGSGQGEDKYKDADCKLILFLKDLGIRLHWLPPEELLTVLDFPDTKQYQAFYGDDILYRQFRKQVAAGAE